MKEMFKNTLSTIKQRTRFIQGFVVGLFIMSALTYAAVTITTFSANTTISSTDVNANFAALKAKVDQLDVGAEMGISANYMISCLYANTLTANDYVMPVNFSTVNYSTTHNDGGFDTGTGIYTFSSTSVFRMYIESQTSGSHMGYSLYLFTSTDGGSTWTGEFLSGNMSNNIVRKFNTGDKIKLKVGCHDKMGKAPSTATLDASKFHFLIKKF